jgi:hypothetical protein
MKSIFNKECKSGARLWIMDTATQIGWHARSVCRPSHLTVDLLKQANSDNSRRACNQISVLWNFGSSSRED